MCYQDDSVKSSVIYILVQLCAKTTGPLLTISSVQKVCKQLSVCLATAKCHELTLNSMGKSIL